VPSMRVPIFLRAIVARYRSLDLEYRALSVAGRGLFLAVMLMVLFLFVLTRATDVIVGINEVSIPTADVSSSIDLGSLAQGAFSRTSASVVSVLGLFTLIISAMLTGHALRQGTHLALLGPTTQPVRLLSTRTAAVSTIVALGIFITWLLTLATAIRRRAWSTIFGVDLNPILVDTAKAAAIVLSLAIVAGGVLLATRRILGWIPKFAYVGAGIVAVTVVGSNFFLLYTYVGSLINPAVSGGIVLILTLLLWVNICVRVYFGALCGIGMAHAASPE
jgi:hypothetical protein